MSIRKKLSDCIKTIVDDLKEKEVTRTEFHMNHAPKNAATPYVVFRIEDIINSSPSYNATLKMMLYDDRNKTSEKNIENADIIRRSFDMLQKVHEDIALHSLLIIEQNIPSEYLTDKQVIEQQYDIRIYERNN